MKDGGTARVIGAGHAIDVQVELNDAMMRGVVSLPHGWGHDLDGTRLRLAAQRPGANLNALADERVCDPLSGNAVLNGLAVEIHPVA